MTDSDLPTPRYRIGTTVYRPSMTHTTEKLPCPDCLGEQVWRATTPAGVTHLVECPRCQDRYSMTADKLPALSVSHWKPIVETIQIGSIQARTHDSYGDRVTYMTSTTGSGGSVYSEHDMFPTREAAFAAAEVQASLKNAEVDKTAAVLTARRFAHLPLAGAVAEKLRDNLFESWAAFRSIAYLLTDLLPEDPNDDERTKLDASQLRAEWERLERGRIEYPGTYATHPIDALITAVEKPNATRDDAVIRAIDALKAAIGRES